MSEQSQVSALASDHPGPTSQGSGDEFYVGYEPTAPTGIAVFVRLWVIAIFGIGLGAAILLAIVQKDSEVAFFDYGQARDYEGVLRLEPHPMLRVERPGRSAEASAGSSRSEWLLVGFGKQGAGKALAGLEGKFVRLQGTPIYRDDQTMLEVVAGSVKEDGRRPVVGLGSAAESSSSSGSISLGERVLVGEIVDSKCYLGVMKPASWKPHRACASLCIRGGIPPLFVVRENGVPVEHLLLLGPDGRALGDEILDYVAEPLEVRGEVSRAQGRWIFEADPSEFRRIPGSDG